MFHLVKKDFSLMRRDRSELISLLLMPFILISILGLALGNLTMRGFSINSFPVAMVVEQNLSEERDTFEQSLRDLGLPEEQLNERLMITEMTEPSNSLQSILLSDDIAEWMTIETYDSREQAMADLDEGDVRGVIVIPEGFSSTIWTNTVTPDDHTVDSSSLELIVNDYESIPSDIIRSVLSTFVNRYNLEASIAIAAQGQALPEVEATTYGSLDTLTTNDPVSSFQYYTIGMAVMFALYVAPTISSLAYKEKRQHIFGRMMLSGTEPYSYLMSKMVSSTFITFIQLVILFGSSTLIFGTFSQFGLSLWMAIALVSAVFSIAVGSVASLLTSIGLYANNDAASGIFSGLLVTVFAFLGGSFTPVEQFSEVLRSVGNWTPNGAAMTTYLQLMQGFSIPEVLPLLIRLAVMSTVFVIISIALFPKRRLT